MSKSAVQFLGTRQEIFSFIEAIRSTVNVVVATENIEKSKKYNIIASGVTLANIHNCKFIYVKRGDVFDEANLLCVHIGNCDTESICESVISINGTGEDFEYWKKWISKFKRTLLKGAYVVNPYRNSKTFYKNIYYTTGAKQAFDKGMSMKPVAGWNYYLLEQEQQN